jgi:hypothetical protein
VFGGGNVKKLDELLPEGNQDHGRVAVTVSIALRRLDQFLDLGLGQIRPLPVIGVRTTTNCSLFVRRDDQVEVRFRPAFTESAKSELVGQEEIRAVLLGRSQPGMTCVQPRGDDLQIVCFWDRSESAQQIRVREHLRGEVLTADVALIIIGAEWIARLRAEK